MATYTFKDVKKFLEKAPVNDIGYHFMNDDYPQQIIHIYNSKRECNIINKNSNGVETEEVIGKIYFIDDFEVSMIRVNKGIAYYDDLVVIDIDTIINDEESDFITICKNAFSLRGIYMCDIINKMAQLGSTM